MGEQRGLAPLLTVDLAPVTAELNLRESGARFPCKWSSVLEIYKSKKEKRPVAKIDFKPYGAAIKAGRTKQKESRNKAADALFISPRYLANIENKGQHPSVQVFLELMSRYHISVDQILHGETMEGKSTERMQFETLLDELTDAEIKILTATAQALLDARTDNEGEN